MVIGVYGALPFYCASGAVQTFRSFTREHATKWAKHEVIGQRPVLEWTGHELPTLSLDARLDMALGSLPQAAIALAKRLLKAHAPLPLILGGEYMGTYVLEGFTETRRHFNGAGACIVAEISLKLLEAEEGLL